MTIKINKATYQQTPNSNITTLSSRQIAQLQANKPCDVTALVTRIATTYFKIKSESIDLRVNRDTMTLTLMSDGKLTDQSSTLHFANGVWKLDEKNTTLDAAAVNADIAALISKVKSAQTSSSTTKNGDVDNDDSTSTLSATSPIQRKKRDEEDDQLKLLPIVENSTQRLNQMNDEVDRVLENVKNLQNNNEE